MLPPEFLVLMWAMLLPDFDLRDRTRLVRNILLAGKVASYAYLLRASYAKSGTDTFLSLPGAVAAG